jgi:26S proteasome regulatory subunit N12
MHRRMTWLKRFQQKIGDVLEIGAFYSVKVKDIAAFERYMAQLYTFYLDYRYAVTMSESVAPTVHQ